ncbi:lysine--tRNA ligase [Plesiomonas shigelloides]|uniref:lysine--tRNA ligase n=1 Tax=Plesiomonas shigelloides TaxID=703 RepID=UPI0022477E82|nr:lysine--tRNA ligase [Plesiomonas shigelloides]MCX2497715.1 lysine--tRNA ligase [Plesiomonas shigelloides]
MSEQQNLEQESTLDLNSEMATRRAKLAALREEGIAFPNDFRRDSISGDLHAAFDDKSKEELEALGKEVIVAGRIMTRRIMGKAAFVTLQDMGGQIQLYVSRDELPEGVYNEKFKKWDMGDIIGARGKLFKTQTGELTIHCSDVRLLTKALRPLPDKFHGLSDMEMRYRQRYLDLITNPESRRTFEIRSKVISGIRRYLEEQNFVEVETPMLHPIPGGTTALPFATHHNALDQEMFLRIAPELYLKRLVIGGMERVFEINRNFRNEGLSARHNPEFTMLEFYQAYADYNDLMDKTEDMLRTLAMNILGSTTVHYGDHVYDFGKPFDRLTPAEATVKYTELTMDQLDTLEAARATCDAHGIKYQPQWGVGRLQVEIFEELAEHCLIQPTFITKHPAETSPLARANDEDPTVTDRFELFIGAREIANAYSELNDPEDQDRRFRQQLVERDSGDAEAMHYDADYIMAMEYGLPPTAGEGIGIDRLAMIFANAPSIRDVILFPAMRLQK